jgi:hypothetical protein
MNDIPTDLCIARPARQARCAPQVQIPDSQPSQIAIRTISLSSGIGRLRIFVVRSTYKSRLVAASGILFVVKREF